MADTSYAVNDSLAVQLWAKKLEAEVLKQTYIGKFIGESADSLIHKKKELGTNAGDKVTFGLRMQLAGDGVEGDGILEGNEESLTTYSDAVYINQLRHAVRSGGKMSEQRVPFSVRNEAMSGLKDWMAGRVDTAFFNQICGVTDQTDTRYTGHNATIAPSSTRLLIAETGSTTESQIDSGDTFNLTWVDEVVTRVKLSTPLIRPIMVDGEEKYVMFLHPYQVRDMRTSTTTGQWLDIQKAALSANGSKKNPIYTGALGEYNGVVFHESTRIPVGTNSGTPITTVRRAVLCGAQAAAIGFGKGTEGVSSANWTEKSFDYGNKLGVAGGIIWGLKKTVFNSVDFGTFVVSSYAAASA
jgi:N4-gp56 family major capsid protein